MHSGTSGTGGTSGTVAGVCTNCGAPLDIDEDGKCRWCHATLRVKPRSPVPTRRVVFFGDDTALVPGGVDDCSTSAPFLYLTIGTFDAV